MLTPSQDRRQLILDAALAEFAAKGFKGATIKSIAAAVRLQSPSLIYWYFPDKRALFRAVLAECVPPVATLLARLDPAMPPEDLLPLVGQRVLRFQRAANPRGTAVVRLVLSGLFNGDPADADLSRALAETVVTPALGWFAAYLAGQVALGRLRPHDTQAAAGTLLAIFLGASASGIAGLDSAASLEDQERFLAAALDLVLAGLRAA